MSPTAREALFSASCGERTVPGVWQENYWFRRHEVAYEHVAATLPAGLLLEAGSGEGYGASILGTKGAQVIGIDYDPIATAHQRSVYPRLGVLRGNLVCLPLGTSTVDGFVSMQTVEHLWDQDAFLAEGVRVTRPGGPVVVSTPNRLTFPPGNPHHPHELDPQELLDLMNRHATGTRLRCVRHGPRIAAWEAQHGSLVDRQISTDPTTWSHDLVAMVTSVTADDFVVTDDDPQDCLDLIAVAAAP